MCRLATDLSSGDPLPEENEVARYCSRKHCPDDVLQATAFVRRENEDDLSVFRLQTFPDEDREGAVNCIRREARGYLTVRRSGRFVTVKVGQLKRAAQGVGAALRVIYSPKRGGPSHSSVVDLPDKEEEELRVATAIMRLVSSADIHPGLL